MNRNIRSSVPFFEDDGFSITAAEPWFKVKVQLIQQYLYAFVANAASRFDDIIFVDLFAGSGFYAQGFQREIFAGASLHALSSDLPVSKWVLCTQNPEHANALKIRVSRYFRRKNVLIFDDHPHNLMDKFRFYIPPRKDGYKPAVLCLVDPFSFDINFSTLENLACLGYHFLIPYTFVLNDRRDFQFYVTEKAEKLNRYLGGFMDMNRFAEVKNNIGFYKKVVKSHQHSMLMLGLNPAVTVHKVESDLMEVPLYYIGFYSRNFSSKTVLHDVKALAQVQYDLFGNTQI